jgi:hypothetical protein
MMSFRVWLVVDGKREEAAVATYGSSPDYGYNVEPYDGGPFEEFSKSIRAIYRTEAEARAVAAVFASRESRSVFEPKPPMSPYGDEVIAWLGFFIVLDNEWGDATWRAQATFGGETGPWNDDRDIVAIFATRDEALAWEAMKNAPKPPIK